MTVSLIFLLVGQTLKKIVQPGLACSAALLLGDFSVLAALREGTPILIAQICGLNISFAHKRCEAPAFFADLAGLPKQAKFFRCGFLGVGAAVACQPSAMVS